MSNIAGRLRAVIGAMGIIVFATPMAAQTHQHGGRTRFAAQWVARSQGAARSQMRWGRAAAWRMEGIGWRRGYAVRYGWRGPGFHRPWIRRGVVARFGGPRYLMPRRAWRRPWAHWRYGVG